MFQLVTKSKKTEFVFDLYPIPILTITNRFEFYNCQQLPYGVKIDDSAALLIGTNCAAQLSTDLFDVFAKIFLFVD